MKVWRAEGADVKVWRAEGADVKVWRTESAFMNAGALKALTDTSP